MAETIGSLTDKLSIINLKIYHMQEQLQRTNTTDTHKQECNQKIAVMNMQRTDLSTELDELLNDCSEGRKKIKIYRQFKMYNDPKYI